MSWQYLVLSLKGSIIPQKLSQWGALFSILPSISSHTLVPKGINLRIICMSQASTQWSRMCDCQKISLQGTHWMAPTSRLRSALPNGAIKFLYVIMRLVTFWVEWVQWVSFLSLKRHSPLWINSRPLSGIHQAKAKRRGDSRASLNSSAEMPPPSGSSINSHIQQPFHPSKGEGERWGCKASPSALSKGQQSLAACLLETFPF